MLGGKAFVIIRASSFCLRSSCVCLYFVHQELWPGTYHIHKATNFKNWPGDKASMLSCQSIYMMLKATTSL